MRDILFEYEMNPTTWVYLSSLLIVGIYFKFHRFWSVRNLDLLGLIALSPGLLLISRRYRADRLRVAVHRRRMLPRAAAAGPLDGPPPPLGAEPLGQRVDLLRGRVDALPCGQRLDRSLDHQRR